MSLKLKNILLIATYLLLFSNCKKQYPEDEKLFNLKSPRKRLIGGWVLDKASPYQWVPNGEKDEDIKFNDDGTCNGGECWHSPNRIYCFDGTWELIEDESKLKITLNGSSGFYRIFEIMRLESRFMVKHLHIKNDSISCTFYR